MGADFVWRGSVPDPDDQAAIVGLVRGYLRSPNGQAVLLQPTGTTVETLFVSRHGELEPVTRSDTFYGLVPYPEVWLRDLGSDADWSMYDVADPRAPGSHLQFVFDRDDGGRMVTLTYHPSFRLGGHVGQRTAGGLRSLLTENGHVEVIWAEGGFTRVGASTPLALLLRLIQMRFAPDLGCSDDHASCHRVSQELREWGIEDLLRDRSLDFEECWAVYRSEYDRRHPPPPPPPPLDPWLTPIEDLELRDRVRNCLRRAQIRSVEDLATWSPSRLLNLTNFGERSLREVEVALAQRGLSLQPDD